MTNNGQRGRNSGLVAVLLGLIGVAFVLLVFSSGMVLLGLPRFGFHGLDWHRVTFFPFFGLFGLWSIIQIGLAIWVGVDANRRGSNGFLWGLLVLFTPIIGLIVYLILAPTLAQRNGVVAASPPSGVDVGSKRPCPGCSTQIEADFKVCPFCGISLCCGQCGKPLQSGWKLCPYCGAPAGPDAGQPVPASPG
jgi:RNA polymerase subunit RPABC4/transcription elongation factor Spt4